MNTTLYYDSTTLLYSNATTSYYNATISDYSNDGMNATCFDANDGYNINMSAANALIYAPISFVCILSLCLFVPHALLSSFRDSPSIYYRGLMIVANLTVFSYAIIVNIYGFDTGVDPQIRNLCMFLDWLYLLLAIPMVVPFVQDMITAAQTANQALIFESKKATQHKLSLVSVTSGGAMDDEDGSQRISKAFIVIITLIVWIACVGCQLLSWTQRQGFYELILFRHILTIYVVFTSLFVCLSFITLYRELHKVQASFVRYQQRQSKRKPKGTTTIQSSGSDGAAKSPPDESSDSSDNQTSSGKLKTKTQTVIENLAHHKRRFLKSIVFVVFLSVASVYQSISTQNNYQCLTSTAYMDQPYFKDDLSYAMHVLSRLLVTIVMYLWLAIPNLFKKKAPRDSIGYKLYSCCFCKCAFPCCSCCACIRVFCDREQLRDNASVPEFQAGKLSNDMMRVKKQQDAVIGKLHPPKHTNMTSSQSSLQYADVNLMDTGKDGRALSIKISKSGEEQTLPKPHHSGKTKSGKFLDFSFMQSRNSTRDMMSQTMQTEMMGAGHSEDFTALPTYNSAMHRDQGLGAGSPISYDGDGSPLRTHQTYPSGVQRKASEESHVASDDSDEMMETGEAANDLIEGVKCVVYLWDVLLENMNTVYDYNWKALEPKTKRLSEHLDAMHQDHDFEVYVLSNAAWTKKMKDVLDYAQLKRCFKSDDGDLHVIGYDHEWVKGDNKNLQLMLLNVIKQLKIENDELLFVGNKKVIQMIENINVCQNYNVDQVYPSHSDLDKLAKATGVLKDRDFKFLESRVLSGI